LPLRPTHHTGSSNQNVPPALTRESTPTRQVPGAPDSGLVGGEVGFRSWCLIS